jgi:predicted glycogen debranching enzyme
MINFDSDICTNFSSASSREWLETNGIGGFASGTISGANTRRYHALLTAATRPPLGRITMLSKFEETVFIDGKSFDLSSNQYPNDTVYPNGYQYLKNFRLAPFPVWTFRIEGIEIEKKIFMVDGENTTVCQWSIVGGQLPEKNQATKDEGQRTDREIGLRLKPLLSFVDYHHLQRANADFNFNFEPSENLVTVKPYAEMPPLFFAHNAQAVGKTGVWYRNFQYPI